MTSVSLLKPKRFNHTLVELPTLERKVVNGWRVYETPTGKKYPSMTTVLGWRSKKAIQEWRDKVGAEEADKISRKATGRGTLIHAMCEHYVRNEHDVLKTFSPENQATFKQIRPALNRIDNIMAIEAPLFSHEYCVAGQVDLIADFDGIPSTIDFKTAMKPKLEEWITDYFLQTTGYSLLFEEMTGIKTEQIVVIIAVDNTEKKISEYQVFVKKREDYIQEFIYTVDKFYELVKKGEL